MKFPRNRPFITDPERAMNALLGQVITGVEINTVDETVTVTTNHGYVLFEGDSLEMYISLPELQS